MTLNVLDFQKRKKSEKEISTSVMCEKPGKLIAKDRILETQEANEVCTLRLVIMQLLGFSDFYILCIFMR